MRIRVLPAVLLLVGVFCGVVRADDNLVQNPGFEDPECPGCPPVAANWTPYSFGPTPTYYIYYYASAPTLVYEGKQSQSWSSSLPGEAGVYQEVTTGVTPGEVYEARVWFGDPGSYGPTVFRVGIQPTHGPPTPGAIIYSDWTPVAGDFQLVQVRVQAQASGVTVVLEAAPDPSQPPGNWRVLVDNAALAQGALFLVPLLTQVPDACQPPNNPLGIGNITNWCTPMAAVNMTWYWDQVVSNPPSPGVNDNWVINTSAAYIGWWMDTNDLGCANRQNGHPPNYPTASGTYVVDMAPGLTSFVRWDATHSPCPGAPALPASKLGYDWRCLTYHNGAGQNNWATAWNQIKNEIKEGRPLMVTWSYWILNGANAFTDPFTGVVYYDWGPAPQAGQGPENWNNPENKNDGITPRGDKQIGHTTTAIGYKEQYDPDGNGVLPKDNWVIVRDTWANTPAAVAVPWNCAGIGTSPWVANTRGIPKGTLDVTGGPMNPSNHWTPVANVTNIMAQIRFTAGPSEPVTLNSLTLTAGGTGNSINDIARVDLIADTNSNGLVDAGEAVLAFGAYALPAPGSLTLNIGQAFVVPRGQSVDLLVVYTMKAPAVAGRTYNFQLTSVTAKGQRTLLAVSPKSGLPFSSSTKTLVPGPCVHIPNVPDTLQPPNDPLGVGAGNLTNWCGAAAAVNVTYYWDQVALDPRATNVNDAWAAATGEYYMGWWMDTNNIGCPFRMNGTTLAAAGGTYVGDIAPGVAEYARWDSANTFGVISPMSPPPFKIPVCPAQKMGYSWTVSTKHDQNCVWNQAWTDIKNEIDAGRPLLVTWRYWNPQFLVTVGGVEYYNWGVQIGGGPYGESWNNESSQQQVGLGDGTIGHVVTAVGYCPNYDPLGGNNKLDWVIVHDTWGGAGMTGTDVAIPFWNVPPGQPNPWSPWAANTFVRLAAPTVGSLRVTCPNVIWLTNWVAAGTQNVYVANILLSAGATEDVVVNVVELKASGTGNDQNDITLVSLYDDDNKNGKFDPPGSADPDTVIASGVYPADDGTLRLVMPGPSHYVVQKNTNRRLFAAYNMSIAAPVLKKYTCSIPAIYATGGTTFLPVTVTGLPYTGGTVGISQIVFPPPGPGDKIGWWKSQADGVQTTLYAEAAPVVSAGIIEGVVRLTDKIYVQSLDRSSGLQMYVGQSSLVPPDLPEGTRAEFEAVIDTINGERALVQPNFIEWYMFQTPDPVGMTNRAVGGGDWLYDPETGAGQKGVLDAYGLNNIGLLARIWGKVVDKDTSSPPTWFRIDDGSGLLPPLKVGLPDPWEVGLPDPWEYAVVTGICSCEQDPETGDLSRLIRVRMPEDIEHWP